MMTLIALVFAKGMFSLQSAYGMVGTRLERSHISNDGSNRFPSLFAVFQPLIRENIDRHLAAISCIIFPLQFAQYFLAARDRDRQCREHYRFPEMRGNDQIRQ